MWGKQKFPINPLPHPRSTPTRVGKTVGNQSILQLPKVHPHACGENDDADIPPYLWGRSTPTRVGKTPLEFGELLELRGPPPRVWGKLNNAADQFLTHLRSTPTRVGKTRSGWGGLYWGIGPPPRVWGKRYGCYGNFPMLRWSTPTRVGKTSDCVLSCFSSAVHPHACGENFLCRYHRYRRAGPPPRVWGKQCAPHFGVRNTAVHPHACGENYKLDINSMYASGPPPRVWGKHIYNVFRCINSRSTPTRVGKTYSTAKTCNCLMVHPHACGENSAS